MKQIGFIGVGHMGGPMAIRLIEAGYALSVFDISDEALKPLLDHGAKRVDSVEVLAGNDIIFTMLQTGEQVEGAVSGLFHSAKQGTYFVDCSSIDVGTAKRLHEAARAQGHYFLDAPVSGGVVGAANGTLTIMVGGDNETLDTIAPILAHLGKNVIHAGAAGCGQVAKICNNMILGVSMAVVSEAFNLAASLGLEPQRLFDICTNSSGRCWSLDTYCPYPGIMDNVPSSNDYRAGFMAKMMLKDLNLSQDAAEVAGVKTPLGEHARALYQAMCDAGSAELDFSAIIQELAK